MPLKFDATFRVELLRADDLLHLQVEGSNLHIAANETREPFLVVTDPDQPAFLRYLFAPQTIAETAFFEEAETPTAPGTVAARLGQPSRLVFVVPPSARIPFSRSGLLDWSKLQLNVNGIAALGDEPSASQIAAAPDIREPAPTETALELPYRLVISPTGDVAWLHRRQPFTSRGRTELWHTRLALKTAAGVSELSVAQPAPLRAIWSLDYNRSKLLPQNLPDRELGRTALSARDRHQLVVLSSAFRGYQGTHKVFTEFLHPISLTLPYVPVPFHADRLMLSALGGWLRSRGNWEPPAPIVPSKHALPDFATIFERAATVGAVPRAVPRAPAAVAAANGPFLGLDLPTPEPLDLSEWVHLATQGRDHYVKVVHEGELWPFRHPAARVTISERKFRQDADGVVGAYLMQRMFVIVRQPVMQFAATDHGNPLKTVRLTTVVTPDIAPPAYVIAEPTPTRPVPTPTSSFWVEVMTGPTQVPFKFHVVGTDGVGATVDFTAALLFVSKSDVDTDPGRSDVVREYKHPRNLARRACAIAGQKIAFAPPDPKQPTETTSLITDSLNFIMDEKRVQPTLLKAAVKIPQLQELLGTDQPTDIRLFPAFVEHGLDAPDNATGVFAQIVDASYDTFTAANPTQTLGVKIAAEKAGGIATPDLGVTTLSRKLGPLAGKVEDAVKDSFDPKQFFPKGAAMLFGSFDLLDLFLPPLTSPASMTLGENAPKLRTERQPQPGGGEVLVTTLDWQPKFLEPGGKLDLGIAVITKDLHGAGTSTLSIHGAIKKPIHPAPLGAPSADAVSSEFSGLITDFSVSVLNSVLIQFESFSFRQSKNEKTKVDVRLDPENPVLFRGELAFIEEIRQAIPPGLFGDGPSLDLITDPLGIRAGFAFALPPLTVGVFTLKDVKLGAALTLPFLDGKPVFDFNISERQHPFLLAVSIFGGGGFFLLQLDTAGMRKLEVALEFGATAALDIGVASGEVHVMAGIYFSLQRKEGTTHLAAILSGYLRLGGSLNVLGIISISVEFNLSFTYDTLKHKAYGRATLTVSVHVLCFSKSVELTVERAFGGSGDPHFIDFFPTPEPWEQYALAFS